MINYINMSQTTEPMFNREISELDLKVVRIILVLRDKVY